MRLSALVITLVLASAGWSLAQQVRIEFNDGYVTLRAQNAPIRTILAEWAQTGGVQIVNADRVTGAPVTLELTHTPERQALDVLLRGVAGFMIGRRAPGTSAGRSAFDRIHILPTAEAPSASGPVLAAQPARPPGAIRAPIPAQVQVPDILDIKQIEDPVVTGGPVPPTPPLGRSVASPTPLEDPQVEDETGPPSPTSTVGSPFGNTTGTARPGIIAPVERQPTPQPAR